MKTGLLLMVMLVMLTGCVRPATLSDWSPINNSKSPTPALQDSIPPKNTQDQPAWDQTSVMALPTADWDSIPAILPASMKGYELVSWQSGADWNYTLTTGTNRSKTFEELIAPGSTVSEDGYVKISVTGLEEIKKALGLLPAGEEVYWSGMDLSGQVPTGTLYFSYPPQQIISELLNYCINKGIVLHTLQDPE